MVDGRLRNGLSMTSSASKFLCDQKDKIAAWRRLQMTELSSHDCEREGMVKPKLGVESIESQAEQGQGAG